MSGFSGETASAFASVLGRPGLRPSASALADDTTSTSGPLAPGDAVGVSLISGDLTFGATGTVTHVDGSRVYAFGHPFFNLGPIEFPMTKAWVQTLLPSLSASAKLAAIGDVIGTIQQDRATGIAGALGRGPDLVPVSLTLAAERGPSRTFRFGIVKDQLFTPLLTFASIVNTLQSYEREFGAATFTVRGKTIVRDHGTVALEDIFTGETPAIGAAAYVAGPTQPAAAQRSSAGADRSRRPRHPVVRGASHRDHRARVARHARAEGRLHGPGAHPHAQLSRRRAHATACRCAIPAHARGTV